MLLGLTIDCCVLSTAQELSWRGYYAFVLYEGVDHASGRTEDKDQIFESPLSNWANKINWDELKATL